VLFTHAAFCAGREKTTIHSDVGRGASSGQAGSLLLNLHS